MPEAEPLQQVDKTYVRFRGRKLSYFAGCDYFRLSFHPTVAAALKQGLARFGLNVAASRLTTGNHALYGQLEGKLKNFFSAPDALLTPSGTATNLIVAQALRGEFSHAIIDEHSHPSLNDAALFLDCPVLRFKHCDPGDLKRGIARCGPGARILAITDGLFSRDGAVPPLKEYLGALPADAMLLVDDAHAAGIIGRTGKGSPEYAGISRARVIQTVTLSKALGVYGGAILGTPALRNRIIERSTLFVGSTPLPLPLAMAASQSISLLRKDRRFINRLHRNASFVKKGLRAAGFEVPENPGPIVAIEPGDARFTAILRKTLLRHSVFPSFIRYPGGPANEYLRLVISSEHTPRQLADLVAAFRAIGRSRD